MFLLSEAALFFVRLYIVPIILLFPCVFKKYIYCMEYYARCKSTALTAVSYTHLDVYKRQGTHLLGICFQKNI